MFENRKTINRIVSLMTLKFSTKKIMKFKTHGFSKILKYCSYYKIFVLLSMFNLHKTQK